MGRTIGVTRPVYGKPSNFIPPVYGLQSMRIGGGGGGGGQGMPLEPSLTDPCVCLPGFDPLESLRLLDDFISLLIYAMTKFYVSSAVKAPLSAKMTVRGRMPFKVYVRVLWGKQNPGVIFNAYAEKHINQLKDIYLSFGMDWRNDKFLVEWVPPVAGQ